MKKMIISLVLLLSICLMQGKIGGYAIFDYQNMHGSDNFDIKRAYFQYSDNISEDLFFKFRLDVGRDIDIDCINCGELGTYETDNKLSAYIKIGFRQISTVS